MSRYLRAYKQNCPIDLSLASGTSELLLNGVRDVNAKYAAWMPLPTSKGVVSGIMPTPTLVAEVKRLSSTFSTSFCGGAQLDSLLAQVAQASDVLTTGGTDPTKVCDGVSFGFGYETAKAYLIGTEVWSPTSPCP